MIAGVTIFKKTQGKSSWDSATLIIEFLIVLNIFFYLFNLLVQTH